MTSKHYSNDRQTREELIKNTIGYGNIVARFTVDRGHKNGAEIHEISDTGIITVYNKRTGKLVTKMVARPGQIKRYYTNGKAPKELLSKAYENVNRGFNYV